MKDCNKSYIQPRAMIMLTEAESVVCTSTGDGSTETLVFGEEESW